MKLCYSLKQSAQHKIQKKIASALPPDRIQLEQSVHPLNKIQKKIASYWNLRGHGSPLNHKTQNSKENSKVSTSFLAT